MKRVLFFSVLFVFVNTVSWSADSFTYWGYKGAEGPEHWGDLSPKFSTCKNGLNQSPINITDTTEALLSEIDFQYDDVPLSMINNGHTVKVNYTPGSHIEVDGQQFSLIQFHFHSPSENYIDGIRYPLEVHLVHKSAEGQLAVIGIMFKEGAKNPMIEGLWSHLQSAKIGELMKDDYILVNAYGLLPTNGQEYYRFNGSLTTPPCTEGVTWMVMKEPLQVSASQVRQFVDLIGNNSRPLQTVNARPVLK